MQADTDPFDAFLKNVFISPDLSYIHDVHLHVRERIEGLNETYHVRKRQGHDRDRASTASVSVRNALQDVRHSAVLYHKSGSAPGAASSIEQTTGDWLLYGDFRARGELFHLLKLPPGMSYADELDYVEPDTTLMMSSGAAATMAAVQAAGTAQSDHTGTPGYPYALGHAGAADTTSITHSQGAAANLLAMPHMLPIPQTSSRRSSRSPLMIRDVIVQPLTGIGGGCAHQALFTSGRADSYVVCGADPFCYEFSYHDYHGPNAKYTSDSVRSTKRLKGVFATHTGPITNLAVSPDHSLLVTCSLDGTAVVHDMATYTCRSVLEHSAAVTCATITTKNQFIVTGSANMRCCVYGAWRLSRWATPLCMFSRHTDPLTCVEAHPVLPLVASGCEAGSVFLWEPATTTVKATIGKGVHQGPIIALSFNGGGSVLLSADPYCVALSDCTGGVMLNVFDQATIPALMTHPITTSSHPPVCYSAAMFAPQEYFHNHLVLCTTDGSISIIEMAEECEDMKMAVGGGTNPLSSKLSNHSRGSAQSSSGQLAHKLRSPGQSSLNESQSRNSLRRVVRRSVEVLCIVWSTQLRMAACCGRASTSHYIILGDVNGGAVVLNLVPNATSDQQQSWPVSGDTSQHP